MASKITFICQMDFNAFPVDIQVKCEISKFSFLLKVAHFCVSVINIPAAIYHQIKSSFLENLALTR